MSDDGFIFVPREGVPPPPPRPSRPRPAPPRPPRKPPAPAKPGWPAYAKAYLFHTPEGVDTLVLAGRALLLALLVVWGLLFIFHSVESNYAGESCLHRVNLVFHEAGHLFFSPFGKFVSTLGGSLGQLLMPTIVLFTFLLKNRDPFGAAVGLWWTGQNFLDLAPYINDARDLDLILLGGVTGKDTEDYHDWEYILGHLKLLRYDHFLAGLSHGFGALLMLTALAWAGFMLFRQYQQRER